MSSEQNTLAKRVFAICSICGRVRIKNQFWEKVPSELLSAAGTVLSHGICPECTEEHYADLR
ncbi:MAG: hypothetical protein EHM28_09955 [Spirochaetaceae bacterium]|nr:MAG: hypothetical protein EHM28_09955 [Spirochaetaceae bacterium]